MPPHVPKFEVRLAQSAEEVAASQRLRYSVFVEELGADGPMVDHTLRLEVDQFDPFLDHMIVLDHARKGDVSDKVVGVYRLMPGDRVEQAGAFYSEAEYDLTPLRQSGRRLLELGRSCLHPAYRGGPALYHLWNRLAAYTLEHEIEVLFGTASFHGTDLSRLSEPLSLLHQRHLAPDDLRVRAQPGHYQSMSLMSEGDIDKNRAMREIPALIKAYLRLGGFVGDGAFVDHAFNTTDICVILDTTRMNERQHAIYTRGLPT